MRISDWSSTCALPISLRARHVFPVAAIEALDRLRPLPDRRANAVHRSVAAADHDDILVLGVQAAVLKLGHGIAKADAVGGSQIIECLHYAARAAAGRLDVAGLVDASGDQDRVMRLAPLVHGCVEAAFEILMKADAPLRPETGETLEATARASGRETV